MEKFRRLGNVDTAVIGRPYSCIAIHPHEELVVMEVLLQHPAKKCMKKQGQNMRVRHCSAT